MFAEKNTIYECHICNLSKSELVPCADPESFVRRGPTLTFFLVDAGRGALYTIYI